MDINTIVSIAMSVPVVGPYVVIALKFLLVVTGIITPLVALAHSAIALLKALSKVPGLYFCEKIAESLKVKSEKSEGFYMSKIHPVIDRLSLIPIPEQKK